MESGKEARPTLFHDSPVPTCRLTWSKPFSPFSGPVVLADWFPDATLHDWRYLEVLNAITQMTNQTFGGATHSFLRFTSSLDIEHCQNSSCFLIIVPWLSLHPFLPQNPFWKLNRRNSILMKWKTHCFCYQHFLKLKLYLGTIYLWL